MKHVLKLANPYDAFICPANKLHLYFYHQVGEATVVSNEILQALKFKKIIDVNGSIEIPVEKKEDETTSTVAKVIIDKLKELEEEPVQEDVNPEPAKEEEQGIDLNELSKKELLSFIKENGMDLKELGLNSKSKEDEVRDAIFAHLQKEAKANEEKA